MTAFLLGSDPELMLQEAATKRLRSAIEVIVEGKGAGRPLDDSGQNTVLHDNVLIEMNTTPAADEDALIQTMRTTLQRVSGLVQQQGLQLLLQASAEFPEEELSHPEARVFGCDPDYDAYRRAINQVPPDAPYRPFRSAGGHLHIGKHTDQNINEMLDDAFGKMEVVKALDVFCAVPAVFLEKDETARPRRELYGRAGCHRPKDYGVEYRALSSWWLASPEHTRLVWRLTDTALQVAVQHQLPALITRLGGEGHLQQVINQMQVAEARQIFETHLVPLLPDATVALARALDAQLPVNNLSAWKI